MARRLFDLETLVAKTRARSLAGAAVQLDPELGISGGTTREVDEAALRSVLAVVEREVKQ
jgi:hypothetical protein